jgi:hypothetical protein
VMFCHRTIVRPRDPDYRYTELQVLHTTVGGPIYLFGGKVPTVTEDGEYLVRARGESDEYLIYWRPGCNHIYHSMSVPPLTAQEFESWYQEEKTQ